MRGKFLSLVLFLGFAPAAVADSLRVAVIHMTEVFSAHPETAKAEAALKAKRAAARKEFTEKANQLKTLLQKHQEVTGKLVDAGINPPEPLKKQAAALLDQAADLEREIAALQTTGERDLEQEFVRERQRILAGITKVIESFNSSGVYAVILDRSATAANGIPQVVHAPGAEDITEQIIKLLKAAK